MSRFRVCKMRTAFGFCVNDISPLRQLKKKQGEREREPAENQNATIKTKDNVLHLV